MKGSWSKETIVWERKSITFAGVCSLLGFDPMDTDYIEVQLAGKSSSFHLPKGGSLILSKRTIERTGGDDDNS